MRVVDEGVRRAARPTTRRTRERAQAFAAKVRDVAEFLVEVGPVAPRHPLPVTVAYHDACHLGHAQGIRSQPRELLRGIPGLELREIADAELCCGSAGIYNLLHPEPARELGDRKAANVLRTGAAAAGHRQPGLPDAGRPRRSSARAGAMALAHTVEVLDASIRGLGVDHLGVPPARASRRLTPPFHPSARHFNDEVNDVPTCPGPRRVDRWR